MGVIQSVDTYPTHPVAPRSSQHPLTGRQREIVMHLHRGMSNREIAIAMCLSEKTVRNAMSDILGELGLKNRTQLALWGEQSGLSRESDH
ncbi:MAG: response regulator transcription factor [Anaerolineales bacterium]